MQRCDVDQRLHRMSDLCGATVRTVTFTATDDCGLRPPHRDLHD